MAMGTRRHRQRQEELWCRRDLAEASGHPFHRKLDEVLEKAGFDEFCEARCRQFYHEKLGRPNEATNQEVFGWVLRHVARAGLLKGKTIGIDATTLEANAAMKSIVRRDTEERLHRVPKAFSGVRRAGSHG